MLILSTPFHPTLVGYSRSVVSDIMYTRFFGEQEFSIKFSIIPVTDKSEIYFITVYERRNKLSFMKNVIERFRCDTIEAFYQHLSRHMPSYYPDYIAVLNSEYRTLVINELVATLE